MKTTIALVLLLSSLSAFAVRLEIETISGQYKDPASKKVACSRALENFKKKVKETCDEVEGRLTNEWTFKINHSGYNLFICTVTGSGVCETTL